MEFKNKELLAQSIAHLIYCKYHPATLYHIKTLVIDKNESLKDVVSSINCAPRVKRNIYRLISHQYHKRITKHNVHMYTKKKYGVKS